MVIIGLTGGISSGKTTITNIFSLLDIPVYIADIESRRVTATSPIIKQGLIELFGEALFKNGELDKKVLASYIFAEKEKLELVNKIIHPEVRKDCLRWINENKGHKVLVIESAILFESGFNNLVDKTVTVYTPLEERIRRTIQRDKISREEVLKRINSQISDEKKKELSDFAIYNNNDASLIEQVISILRHLNIYEQ